MRIVIATFDGVERVRALALAWHAAALPADRLHIVADARVTDIGPGVARDMPLVRVAVHDRWSLWVLTDAAERTDALARRGTRDERRRQRRGLTLLGRLIVAGERIGWSAHADALARGQRLGVVRLEHGGEDALAFTRPLLAAASAPVQVSDLSSFPVPCTAPRAPVGSVRAGFA